MSCSFVNMSLQGHRCSEFMERAPWVSWEPHKYEADVMENCVAQKLLQMGVIMIPVKAYLGGFSHFPD